MEEPRRPRPTPSGAGAPGGITRRWFVAGGVGLVLGAGAGVGAEFWNQRPPTPLPEPPAALVGAAAAERSLLADLVATTGGPPAVRAVLATTQADHTAHLAAIEELLRFYRPPSQPATPPPGTPRTLAELRAAEERASAASAA
ncbi:MAG: hypothetical protein J0H43_01260, partial [Actinobacteria bacterium]|nr:hypothetical protein [Actinomycetota bacterium]